MLPHFAIIKQQLPNQRVKNIPEEIRKELGRIQLKDKVQPGMRIAITAGSRGIFKIPLILRTIVDELKAWGAEPFVIPTMGSHGGATADGQTELLRGLGITEESLGVPILSTMDVIEIGRTSDGIPVYLDAHAAKADGIIVVGRIKPHTDFRGPMESGLHKMIAVGLGKHKQALAIHSYGIRGLREIVPQVAQVTLNKAPILCGLAILENGYDETARIEAVLPVDLATREPELLAIAHQMMPKLPVNELDVLIVGEIGKNFSGTGMDTNIIGRVQISGEPEFTSPTIQYIIALRLSEAAHGNALGIGLADFTTEKLMNGIDYPVMRENVITSSFIGRGKIPMAFPNDLASIVAAQRCLWQENPRSARMMYIPNTLEVTKIAVSESLLPVLSNQPGIEVLTPLRELAFDQDMNLDINFVNH